MTLDSRTRRRILGLVLLGVLVLATAWLRGGDSAEEPGTETGTEIGTTTGTASGPAGARASDPSDPSDPVSDLPWVDLDELPPEAADVVDLIAAGGPFGYPDRDGGTFGNREGILPGRPGGHYREYTVDTPGSEDRGARRIVTGADGERYWTDDHYTSFSRIRP